MLPQPLAQLLAFPSRLYYGWRIVALGGLINAVAGGVYQYGFGIFFLPISRDLGLNRADTSLVFSLARAEGAVEGPIAGWLVDKFGPKYVLIVGAILTGLGYMALSQADSFLSFLFIYLVLISISYNVGFAHSTMAAVNTWFIRRRGLAISTLTAAFSVGGAVVAPTLAVVVDRYGWRTATVVAGIALIVLVIPAALGMRRSPESMGLLPDGDVEPPSWGKTQAADPRDFTVREGLRTKVYWGLSVATTLRLAVINVVTIQFVPFMVWKGTDEVTGAFLLATMSALSIPGRIGVGWLGDKMPKTLLLAIGMLAGSAAFIWLDAAQGAWQLWVFVVVFALVESVNPLNWALVGDFFGRKNFATLRGIMAFVYTGGTAAAPWLAGRVYDQTETYSAVMWAMAASYFVGALLFLALRAPAPPARLPVADQRTIAGA
ncbi:MAG: MFS transporter [Chloroflexi bacterium]|nr:MFS transporter [Chloroflexota bacterium]